MAHVSHDVGTPDATVIDFASHTANLGRVERLEKFRLLTEGLGTVGNDALVASANLAAAGPTDEALNTASETLDDICSESLRTAFAAKRVGRAEPEPEPQPEDTGPSQYDLDAANPRYAQIAADAINDAADLEATLRRQTDSFIGEALDIAHRVARLLERNTIQEGAIEASIPEEIRGTCHADDVLNHRMDVSGSPKIWKVLNYIREACSDGRAPDINELQTVIVEYRTNRQIK